MSYISFLFILSNLTIFCNGCLRTPTVDSGPTVSTGPMIITAPPNPCVGSFTTSMGAFIVSETMDASGVFMVQVACPPPFGMLLMNNANFSPNPSTFSCDAASGKYIYFPVGVQTPINTIGCS